MHTGNGGPTGHPGDQTPTKAGTRNERRPLDPRVGPVGDSRLLHSIGGGMDLNTLERRIVHTADADFEPYDLDGPVQENMQQLTLSYDRSTGQGVYMIRMQPGAETLRHVHERREEYLILEGDLIESDGVRLGPGDYVIYAPGSVHNSRTENGCLLIGMDYSWDDRT